MQKYYETYPNETLLKERIKELEIELEDLKKQQNK